MTSLSTKVDSSANMHQVAIRGAWGSRDPSSVAQSRAGVSELPPPDWRGRLMRIIRQHIRLLLVALSKLADRQSRECVMESSNEPRLQLLSLSKDPTHMERITSMLHGHGIQTMTERTSLPWRSAGYESFVMVSAEDYPEASALCLDPDMAGASTGTSHLVTTARL